MVYFAQLFLFAVELRALDVDDDMCYSLINPIDGSVSSEILWMHVL